MLGYTLWRVITEPDSEITKEVNLLGFKDNIIDGDILWSTEGSLDFILMAYQKAVMMETLKEFQLRHLRVKQLAPLTAHCLVFLILQNLEKKFVVSKVHQSVYLIELLKAHLKIFRQWWKKTTWNIWMRFWRNKEI